MTPDDILDQVAARLIAARRRREPISPVRDQLSAGRMSAAYAVQRRIVSLHQRDGAKAVGYKIGATTPAAQKAMEIGHPTLGVLLDTMARPAEAVIDLGAFITPRIEGEIAFLIGEDVMGGTPDAASVAARVRGIAPALEIVDSAIVDWNLDVVDAVADNGCAAGFVLGPWQAFDSVADLASVNMVLTRDGVSMSVGTGAACRGGPLAALVWLAAEAIRVGHPLRAGELILAGALGPMTPFGAGDWRLSIDGFPPLRATAS